MTRTDVHSPTNLTTEDYEFATGGDFGGTSDPAWTDFDALTALAADGWKYAASPRALCENPAVENPEEASGCTCQHCGAHLRYYAVLKHKPSRELIIVGEQCLSNRFARATAEFKRLKKNAELQRMDQRIVKARAAFAAANPTVFEFLADYNEAFGSGSKPYDGFYSSLWAQLTRKGELSAKQIAAVERSIERQPEFEAKRAEFEAKRAEEKAAATPVIEGKIQITGTVLSTKFVDNDFGGALKMLVADDRGFKVWGTVPSSIASQGYHDVKLTDEATGSREYAEWIATPFACKGAKVTFSATVERSRDDESFGFFKRPTKASVLEMPAVELDADEEAEFEQCNPDNEGEQS